MSAVVAQSFERIHRSNLVGMGVLPCSSRTERPRESLGLDGDEDIRPRWASKATSSRSRT